MKSLLPVASLIAVALVVGCNGAASPNGGSSSSAATTAPAAASAPPAVGPTTAPATSATAPSSLVAPAALTGAAAVMAQPPLPPSITGTPAYTVDPAQPTSATNFATLSSLLAAVTLKPGDVVEVKAGTTFSDIIDLTSRHSGAPGAPVVIRATPGAGYATWDASLMNAAQRSALASKGFFWRLDASSHDIEICGIEIENLPVATAAAGPLRGVYFLGSHCSFHHGYVHDNGSDGFMSIGLDTRVESCEVARNGANDGYTHNFYMEGTGTHIRFNYIHDAVGGIDYKDRSVPDANGIAVEVAYNWIANASNGGYELDFAQNTTVQGGTAPTSAYVIGNVIQPATTGNGSQPIAVGDGRVGTVHVVNNTIFAATTTKSLLNVWATVAGADFTNNIVYGGTMALLSGATVGKVTGSNNVASSSIAFPASVTGTVTVTGTAPAAFAPRPAVAANTGTKTLALPELTPVFELSRSASGQLQVNARSDGGATAGASSR